MSHTAAIMSAAQEAASYAPNSASARENIIMLSDSYKVSHWKQYQPGTERIFSFFESRGGRFPEVTFFGLQYFLKKFLLGAVVTESDIEEAKTMFASHFGSDVFNEEGWRHILEHHGGRLPVEIRAVPEGTTVPVGNVLMTVVNTDPNVPWMTNYLETLLSQVWYPSTVATISRAMKQTIMGSLACTGDPSGIGFKLHDFGYRGSTSVESAGIGGAAHLVNFMGTDTMAALRVARDYYHEEMAGFSVPAAEHSTITAWGREREADAFRHMLKTFPSGLVSVVSDSYDVFEACRDLWGGELKDEVLERDGVLVVRPDSGDPATVVVKVLDILGSAFGSEINDKGFKVLHPKVRVIQGDGIDHESLGAILEAMENNGWSADNIVFGSGGGLLQKMDRDTQKFAFKCSATCVDGAWHEVKKDPATDRGKRSKAGKLALIQENGEYRTVQEAEAGDRNLLIPVFRNGELLIDQAFVEIRERADVS